ncbi:uncharacterized protein LOC119092549 [Pollicipes pollicipes]|uniref:uncharacterized protein LOC119092549 n=1 Tax=Pollicipes pollicipes TaxID=41117 RepID=UPI001885171A|nr:uncharacterized protein LOC119092549 [Pollicipes pollicipes]
MRVANALSFTLFEAGAMKFKVNAKLLPVKACYFFFFGGVAPILPFLPVYAHQLGVSEVGVGTIYLALPVLASLMRPLVGGLADATHRHKLVFLLLLTVTTVGYAALHFLPPLPAAPSALSADVQLDCGGQTFVRVCAGQHPSCHAQQLAAAAHNATALCQLQCDQWPDCGSAWCRSASVAPPPLQLQLDLNGADLEGRCLFLPVWNVSGGEGPHSRPTCRSAQTVSCRLSCDDATLMKTLDAKAVDTGAYYRTSQFWLMVLFLVLAWVGTSLSVPLADSIAFKLLDDPARYGYQRVWGSIGWGAFSFLSGYLVDVASAGRHAKDYSHAFYLLVGLMVARVPLGAISQVARVPLGAISQVARVPLGAISQVARVRLRAISHVARVRLRAISLVARVRLRAISHVARVRLRAISLVARVRLRAISQVARVQLRPISQVARVRLRAISQVARVRLRAISQVARVPLGAISHVARVRLVSRCHSRSCCQVLNIIVCTRLRVSSLKEARPKFRAGLGALLRRPRVLLFLLSCCVVGTMTGVLWTFFFLHLQDVALAWDCSAYEWISIISGGTLLVQCFFGEVPFFFISGWIIGKLGHVHTQTVVLLAFGVRFLLYSLLRNPWLVLPVELLNGLTFGLFYANMVAYAGVIAPPGMTATLQGLVGASFECVGVAIGSGTGGLLYYAVGGARMFQVYGLLSLTAGALYVLSAVHRHVPLRRAAGAAPRQRHATRHRGGRHAA